VFFKKNELPEPVWLAVRQSASGFMRAFQGKWPR
jgi:hypothetical protein